MGLPVQQKVEKGVLCGGGRALHRIMEVKCLQGPEWLMHVGEWVTEGADASSQPGLAVLSATAASAGAGTLLLPWLRPWPAPPGRQLEDLLLGAAPRTRPQASWRPLAPAPKGASLYFAWRERKAEGAQCRR